MKPKIMLGNAIIGRCSIMAYVRPCVAWAASNTCIHLRFDLLIKICYYILILTSGPLITSAGVHWKKMKSIQLHDY